MSIMENHTKREICDMLNMSEYMNDIYLDLIENINDKLKLEIDIKEDLNNELRFFWNKICELKTELDNLRDD